MNNSDLGKIGVVMGGISSEREISLKSGKAITGALLRKGLDAYPLDLNTDKEKEVRDLFLSSGVDIVFIALHGYFGEDGKLQSILDDLSIPYTGSGSQASYLSMDKIASRRIFEDNGLSVPRYKIARFFSDFNNLDFNYPVVLKPSTHGSSIGLSIIDSPKDLKDAFRLAKKYDENVIVEEFIEGRELTVGILGDEALPVIEIIPKRRFFDFDAKYQKGLTDYIVPAKISDDLSIKAQESGLKAHRSLGCFGFSRADMILKDGEVFVLELNSIPGMTETSLLPKAAKVRGLGFEDLCLEILRLALTKERIVDVSQKK